MPEDRITMDQINKIAETNPQAASLALGMQFMVDSGVERGRIYDSLMESKDRRIEQLEKELAYYRPLARRFQIIKDMLSDEPEGYD